MQVSAVKGWDGQSGEDVQVESAADLDGLAICEQAVADASMWTRTVVIGWE